MMENLNCTTSSALNITLTNLENLLIQLTQQLSYVTILSAYGGIANIDITYKGQIMLEIVGVSTVVGIVTGTGAILEPSSSTIGKFFYKYREHWFNYPTDFTIVLQQIYQSSFLESLTSFEEIGISSVEETITCTKLNCTRWINR